MAETDTNAMREALEWYAEQVAGCRKIGSAGDPFRHALDRDGGERARNALALLATDRAAGVGEADAREYLAMIYEQDALPGLAKKVRERGLSADEQRAVRAIRLALAASPPAPADASDFSPHRWTEIISNGLGANNAGCWRCGALSEVLARVLSLSGHDAKVIQGKANGEDHVWVQIGDTVYDPTVGQFQEPVSYQMDQVAPASLDRGTGEYQPDAWQVVVDQLGYESVHETDEDGRPGDLVAHVYGDNISLVTSAPRLRKALTALLAIAGTSITDSQDKVFAEARAAIAEATG